MELGANQLFAAKQHRSDRSNGRQDHPQDAEGFTGLRRGLAGIGIDVRIRVALLRAGNIAGSKRRRRQCKHKHKYQKNGHKTLHCVTPPFINLQLLIVA